MLTEYKELVMLKNKHAQDIKHGRSVLNFPDARLKELETKILATIPKQTYAELREMYYELWCNIHHNMTPVFKALIVELGKRREALFQKYKNEPVIDIAHAVHHVFLNMDAGQDQIHAVHNAFKNIHNHELQDLASVIGLAMHWDNDLEAWVNNVFEKASKG